MRPTTTRRRGASRSSTPASRRTTCSSRTTRTRRSGSTRSSGPATSAGSTRGSSTGPVTSRPHRAGARSSSTRMATGASRNRGTSQRARRSVARYAGRRPGLRRPAEPGPGEEDVVWAAITNYPGYLVRLERGANPPETCISEWYRVPEPGYGPRGLDVDRNGVVWTSLAGSSHSRASTAAAATCATARPRARATTARGWTFYRTDGPTFKDTDVPADFQYYNWVDNWNTSGLGENMPWTPGGNSDALLMLDTRDRRLAHVPRALSARVLPAADGRPHRRSGRRLEGPRPLGELRHALRLAHRGGTAKGTKTSPRWCNFQFRPGPAARSRCCSRRCRHDSGAQ
jgi:hypothetical protein